METLLRLLALVAAAYALLCVFFYVVQDRLIFYPTGVWREPQGSHVLPVALERDDAVLNGWVVKPGATGPVLVYFGGNAEELSGLVDVFARLDCTTLLMNYRGYGTSEGRPSVSALIDDAAAVLDVLVRRYGSDRPLILFGRSLGSGIAVSVAQSERVDGVILMSPFRSLAHLADHVVPWLPARWLLRHQLDVIEALDSLPEKTLVLYSPSDRIVPGAESEALLRLFPRAPRVVEFDGGHNVPLTLPGVWREVVAFVEST
ncbi:MAG: alpha/beta hydrolase [Pseudomonadales bacterium]